MAAFPTSLRPITAAVTLMLVYFLPSAHAAMVMDSNGWREVNITAILEKARQNRARSQTQPIATCRRGSDTLVRLGTTWNERCRECSCTESGTQCTGPECAIPYESMQEITCAKFADDCCCAFVGCILDDGTEIPVGGQMPFDPAKPCHSCKCRGGNRTTCVVQSCWPYQCVDMVRRDGVCCPDCPNGRTCVLPSQQRRLLSRAERQMLEPVREFSPVTLMEGTPFETVCRCEGNLIAKCTRSSLPKVFRRSIGNLVA